MDLFGPFTIYKNDTQINIKYKRIVAQSNNHRRTRNKPSFSGIDHQKIPLIPNETDTQPSSNYPQAVRNIGNLQ